MGLTILAYIIYFRLYFVGIAVIGIIILLLTYIPIGKEKYYSVIQHLNYFEEVIYNYFFENPINNWKASLIKKALWFLVFIVIWDFSLISLFEFSVALSTVLCCSVILIVWFYKDRDSKEIQLLKKLIIYIIFFVVTIIGNYQISTDILKIPILFVSLFFALDRIIALSKEVNDLICSKSIIYYLDHNGIKTNNLLKEIIDVTYLSQIDISEIELVRQILIRYQLELNEEIVTLSEIYHRNKEQNYLQLVDGISYFIEFEESWLDNLEELKERVNKIVSYKEQKIYYIRILKEYAFILYYMGDYSESIKYYEDVFMYLDKNEIDNLCKAYEACDQMDQANKVRKNLGIVKGEKQ
ncbi:hypothetical protein [Streptococcus pyogenes]|uniref:hypothetical protein n=1 Tax=Streptococcus pyogenes TaxID=1314 RepID=UPI0010A14ACB|nr:hypothetical protein [Streptococcus pyogenes]